LTCRFTCQNPPATVDNAVALHLYYIVLEAVANASKHGGAGIVLIGLEPRGDRYQLTIRDDGRGFSPSVKGQAGMGLRIMHYRARVIGATLNVQSRPGQGTTVTCLFLPVSRETLSQEGSRDKPRESAVQSIY
jgi:signal transduction histidine kinase